MSSTVQGGGGADPLLDNDQDTYVYGYGGSDTIYAYDDTDGDNVFDGGSGTDTVDYSAMSNGVFVNLAFDGAVRYPAVVWPGVVDDTLVSIENVVATTHSDRVVGDEAANVISARGGDDVVSAVEGHDSVHGGDGDDYLSGGGGQDTIDGGLHEDTVYGGAGGDSILGNAGDDDLYGETGNDTVNGGMGADSVNGGLDDDLLLGDTGGDTIAGGSGEDTVEGGSGDDSMDGGSGSDTVVYTGSYDVTLNLASGVASGFWGNDTVLGFENARTADGDDSVTGSSAANVVETGNGHDTVLACSGDDSVDAGRGQDLVYGHDGEDTLNGGVGDDVLYGGQLGDLLQGGNGDDTLSGGDGADTVYGGSGEDLVRGGAGADVVYGGRHADVFRWEDGDIGTDEVHGLSLAVDRFSFGEGFFAVEPVGATALSDVLYAFPDFAGGSFLMAHTADAGWVAIAQLMGIAAAEVNAMIADESILAVSLTGVGGGGPGGLDLLG